MRAPCVGAAAILAGLAVSQATASGATRATPGHYAFSFTVSLKPDQARKLAPVKVTGTGSGTFSIHNRRIDRDGTIFWSVVAPHGTVSFSADGKVLLLATVVGGTFGTETVDHRLVRSALLRLRITSSPRFHCAAPAATVGLQDEPLRAAGDTKGLQLDACGASLQWNGRPPRLAVRLVPAA